MKSLYSLVSRLESASNVKLNTSIATNPTENLLKKFILRTAGMVALFLFLGGSVWGQTAGFNNTYAILSINGAANAYYDLNAATANTDFNGANLGTFNPASNSLTLKGAEHNVWKCGGCDLTSTKLNYRIYSTTGTAGTFVQMNVPYTSTFANGCGGADQVWSATGNSVNVLSGLAPGTYYLEVYSDATVTCTGGTVYATNGGANYKATFTVSSYVTTNSGSGLAATYSTLAAAITALNAATITSPVVITLFGNETAPAGGYSITKSGTATNTITIQGNGAANTTVTAPTPQTSGNLNDAIFKIIGADFITLQNFTMKENAANTTTTAGSNNMTEFGVALFYATTTDGAQNNTIQNNTISLNRTYQNTFGIYSNTSHSATSMTAAAQVTASGGANSFNKVYGNTISNVNYGTVFIGSGALTAVAGQDNGTDIGGSSSATGNTYTNWGGIGVAPSGYVGLTGNNYCIFVNNTYNDNISFNTITSAVGAAQTGSIVLGGILKNYSTGPTAQPTGTITTTINNNTITLTNAPAVSAIGSVIGINNQGLSPLLSTATISIINNIIQNCVNGGANITSGGLTGITNLSLPGTLNMNGNSFINNAITGATATNGSLTALSNSGAAGTVNINSNIVRGLASTATSGQIAGIINSGAVVTALNINNNALGNSTSGFFSTSTATSGALFGISTSGGAATCATTIQSNDIGGITYNVAASAAQTYITNTAATLSQNISSNTFTNLNVNTTGSVTFISNSVTVPATGTQTISSNSIVTAYNKGGAGGTITLCTSSASSVAGATINHNSNNFSNITVTGSTTIAGWISTDGGTANKTYSGNTFNNWTGGSGTLTGMSINYGGGNAGNGNYIQNNTITNFTGTGIITGLTFGTTSGTLFTVTGNSITGLSSTSTAGAVTGMIVGGSTANVYSNTINTLSSASTTATVAGITTSATTANIYQNTINTLSCVGATSGVTNGIMVTGGTTVNVYRNKVYDLSATGAFTTAPGVNGIVVSAGTTNQVYNNLIGNLAASASTSTDAIRGISITSTTTTSTNKVYNNTVYLTGSGGTNFGSSGIYHAASATSTTANLDLQNNMIFNTCTPSGTGIVTAYRRSAAATLGNYATTSNKNLFFAGTPSATNTIMSDGTNNYQTLASFQTAVSTREANSYSESTFNPSTYFASTTGSNANYLQPSAGLSTPAESGGNTIALCSPDYNGVTRPGFSGAAYDVGAWEFAGVSPAPVLASMTSSPALTTQCTTVARAISINITTASGTITGATLNYNHNGTAQTAITMTNSSSSTWTGTMLAPSTGNATVTWSITATNSLGLSTLYNGTSYADEPNTGITATASASPSTVCDGSNASLSLSVYNSLLPLPTSSSPTYSLPPAITNPTTDEDFGNITITNGSTTILNNTSSINSLVGTIGTATGTAGSYSNFTSFGPYNLVGGSTYNLSISSLQSSTAYTNYMALYIDYNRNGVFSDAGEQVYISNAVGSGAHTKISTFLVPTTALNGLMRMRVYDLESSSVVVGSVVTGSYGEYEEYTINLTGGTPGQSVTPLAYSWSNGSSVVGTTNPLSTPITSGLTYTATATVNSCPMTASVTPTVNPLPNAPGATNSAQCGAGVPSASVSNPNGFTSPTFNWYSAASGGTALQSSTSTTYTTSISSTTTFYVSVVNPSTGCESSRSSVTVTVTQPDAISASTSAASICLGQSITLTAANTATTPTQNYSYSWICSTTGSGATTTNTNNPASVTPTSAGSYTYTVTATDGGCSAVNTVGVTVNGLPTITSATASPSSVCSGANVTLTASSIPSSAGSATIGLGATTATSYENPFYSNWSHTQEQILVLASELSAAGIVAGNLTSLGLEVTSGSTIMPDFSLSMQATSLSTLSTLTSSGWTAVYSNSTGLTPVIGVNTLIFSTPFSWNGTSNILIKFCWGNSTTTATQSNTVKADVTSYVSSVNAHNTVATTGSSICAGTTVYLTYSKRPKFIFGAQVGANQTANYNWSWNSSPAITAASGTTTAVNNTSSAVSQTYTVTATNATTGCTSTATTSAITINPTPSAPTATNSVQCGTGTPTCSVTGTGTSGNTFKWYTVATGGTALTSQSGSTLSNYTVSATTSFYVSETNGSCESARTQVDVTVITPPAITAAASVNPICSGSATTLSVSSTNSSYTYTWDNSAGTGSSVSVSPTTNTTYTVTATDASGGANNGCSATASLTITVNPLPSAVTITPSSATICNGSIQSLVATTSTTFFNEDFNSGLSSWTVTNSGASPSVSNWVAQTAPLTDASGSATFSNFSTSNGGKFAYSNPDAGGSGTTTNTVLQSPAFNTLGAASATLTFEHVYRKWTSGDQTAALEISIDNGATWTVLKDYKTLGSQGTITNSAQVTTNESITLANTYLNQASVKIRFNYVSAWGYFWLIDNIVVTGSSNNISWSPTATLFTDAAATTAYTGTAASTIYAKPTATTTYTATSTSTAGCTSTSAVQVTVNPVSVGGTASSDQTICSGSTPSALTLAGNTGTIQWQSSTTSSTAGFTNISGATSATLTLGALTTTTYYRAVVTSGVCSAANSNVVTITVNPLPTASITGTAGICVNATQPNITFTGASGTAPYTFTYNINGGSNQTVTTSTGNSVTVAAPTSSAGTFAYNLVSVQDASSTTCSQAQSGTATVTVTTAPSAGSITGTQDICINGSTTFSSNGNTGGAWTSGTPAVASVNASTGSITPVSAGTSTITYTVTGTGGCSNATATRTVTINALPTASVSASSPICSGNNATFTITGTADASVSYSINGTAGTATLTNGSATVTVNNATSNQTITLSSVTNATTSCSQSLSGSATVVVNTLPTASISASGATTFCAGGNVVLTASTGTSYLWNNGATTQAITVTASGTYSVTVTNGNNCTATSSATTVVVNALPTVTATADQAVCSGSSAALSGSGASTYAWSNSETTASITVTPTSTTTYTVTGTDGNGCTNTANSTVTVNSLPSVPTASSTSLCGSGAVTLYASISGALTDWYASATGGSPLLQALGQYTTPTLTTTTSYYVESRDGATGCVSATRTAATVTINTPAVPSVTVVSSDANNSICPNESVTFTATPTNGGTSPTYQWKLNGSNVTGTGSTYANSSWANNDVVTVVMTANNSCQSASTATSNSITTVVNATPAALSVTGSTYCSYNNGVVNTTLGSISSISSTSGITYTLYNANNDPLTSIPGAGSALTWTGIEGALGYYVIGVNATTGCIGSTSLTTQVSVTTATIALYTDTDGDNYGAGSISGYACVAVAPSGYSLNTSDCNTTNSAINPGAVEICGNNIDENCSGNTDDIPAYFRSRASGNWGDATTWQFACSPSDTYQNSIYAPPANYTGYVNVLNGHTVTVPNNGTIYQTGTLDVDAGGTLTMTGNDYNNDPTTANVSAVAKLTVTLVIINDGTMNVGHQASLVQTATTAGTVNSGSGNFNVQSKLTGNWSSPTGAPNGRYWYIGSPMNNTVASQFFDTPSMVRLWSYNAANNSWGIVIHSQTSTTSSLKLVPGIGYLYRAGANKTITYTSTAANLNNNITTNLLAPASDAAYVPVLSYTTIGYKYVANPYPSYVDWTLLSRTGLNAGYWIRNGTNTAYDAYNATTQLGSSPSGQTTKFIAPMQGFWVYAYTTPCALRIDNTDRVHSTNVLHAPTVNQVVRLKLNDGKSSDYTVVYENELAANDFEETDTDKMFDYDFHQLYTLEGEHELALNGLLNATSKGSVDMGISVVNNGQYTIEATDLEVEEEVILEDKFNHTFQDMKVNPVYSFRSNAGTFNERFVLHFTNTETVGVGETESVADEVRVFNTSNKQVKVWVSNTTEYQGATVKVYDAIGNLVERKNMTSNELYLDLDIASGIYVVEVTGTNKTFTKKVFITK